MARWLVQALVLTAACVTTGLVALASGPPPTHAPVWPPAGIALAALLTFGRRLWPAVAVSAFLLALVQLRPAGLPWYELLAAAVAVGGLYAAQALVGVWLVRRAVGPRPHLVRTRDVLAFLLVAGPLHALVASVAGSLLLCALGVVAWPGWAGAWLRWWVGDAAGGLAFAPVALAVVGQPRGVWRPRLRTAAVPLAVAAGLVALGVVVARGRDEASARDRVANEADRAAAVVEADFARLVKGLDAVADAYPTTALTLPAARGFIRHDLRAARKPVEGVASVSIDLIVPGGEREAFERDVRRTGRGAIADFRLYELGPDGRPAPAAPRDRHVVVLHHDPPEPDDIGYDAASDPARSAAYRGAAETGRPAVTSPLKLPDGREAVLVVVPVRQRPAPATGPGAVRGFVTAAVDPDRWLAALRPDGDARLRMALVEPGVDPEAAPAGGAAVLRDAPLAGEPWRIAAVAGPDYLAAHRPNTAAAATLGGLLALAVLAGLLLRLTGQAAACAAELEHESSARQSAESSRREAEERLAEAQRVARLGYWEWDPVADHATWSAELAPLFGEPDARGPTAADLLARVHPEDRSRLEAALNNRLADRDPVEAEVRVVRPDGQTRWVAATVRRTAGEAGPVVRGTARDVTDQKLFEENLERTQRLEALGVMAGGVAHDFNNLLTGILGNASLARELLPPGSSLHDYLRPIEKSAEHAAQLCQQMLGYAGRGAGGRGPVDLGGLVEDAGDLLRLCLARQAVLRFEPAPPGLPPVEADAAQVRQVLVNLAQNASESLGSKGGTVTVRTGGGAGPADRSGPGVWVGEPPAGPHAWVEVADTGCGMDAATAGRVFDPFFTTKFTGRGLGLAAVRGIVEAHKGAVRVVSEPGHGSSFRVYLPAAAPRPVGVAEPTPWPVRALRPELVALVADDEPAVRKLAAASLKALGFAAVEAAGGPEAVELFRADPGRFAVVLLDLGLSESGGADVLAELRRVRADVPVVLTSGRAEPADLPAGAAVEYLQKPFRPVDLKGCVRRAIGSTPGPGPR